ncbi:MAG: glycosyltransferase family 2 protein [Bacteroidetes bacterium]|nr:glycosyltransferase family 2 protein [Bacteroidota bacterium]
MPNQVELSIIVPLYNEEKNITKLCDALISIIQKLNYATEILLIDDGSKDNTANIISSIAISDDRFNSIILSRNHGHQLALTAGFRYVRASKAIFILDGDLQDPPEMIVNFLEKFNQGYDVVYGIRKNRKESFLKKQMYWFYYRLIKNIANIDLPADSGDFALISRKVVDYLNTMPEQNRYLRGMRAWVGFKQTGIEYNRSARHDGKSNYSWKKLFELAYSGIFNFSDLPVKFITRLGVISTIIALFYLTTVFIKRIWFDGVPVGFTALIAAIVMFGGVQLISLGIIGEYVLRIYKQVQQRPLFIVDKIVRDKKIHNGQDFQS